jgi:epoxyqueuosine reductase
MKPASITKTIFERVRQNGWQARTVSIEHLKDLEQEIEAHHQAGLLDDVLYNSYLNRFEFDFSLYFNGARSLIVVTAPQSQQRVTFNWQDQTYTAVIPPTYYTTTDVQIYDILTDILQPHGYHLEKKRLPEKLLSARSGLARFGQNNITYVPGMGSFHRPVVFATDMPCEEDSWGELIPSKACSECTACMEACPTGAIGSDRFLVHAERCITFHNERSPEFPDWLDPSWHNSLVGCMICQTVCPLNKRFINWIDEGAVFSEEEISNFINGVPQNSIPNTTIEKLKKLGMMDYIHLLGRNLKALIENQ